MEPTGPGVVSGEGVRLALVPAGVGSRVIAAGLDLLAQAIAWLVLILLDAAVAGSADDAALTAVVILETVLVLAGYPIVCEWLTRGRTLGKIIMGLRAVRDDGGPITFRQALVRGLAGLVLEKPGLGFPITTIASLVTISSSAREKRIGDMMAGTIVLNERVGAAVTPPLPTWVPVPLQAWVLSLDLHGLDDHLALSMRQFVGRAHEMSPDAQQTLGEELRRRVLAVASPAPPAGTPTPVLLLSVLAERRRRALAGTPGPWRPAGPATPGPATPGPATPGPATPGPATPRPPAPPAPHPAGGESSPFTPPS